MLGLGNSLISGTVIPFTPASFGSDLLLWLRHDTGLQESDGTTPEDGENVVQWTDQSSQGNNATASSNYPDYIATGGYVDFASTSEALRTDSNISLDELACYVRLKYTNTTFSSADIFLDDPDVSANFWRLHSSTTIRIKFSGSAVKEYTLHSSTTLTDGVFYNMGLERDSSDNVYSYLNGTANGAAQSLPASSRKFAVDRLKGGSDVQVSEVVIVNRSLTDKEREDLNTWLTSETAG